MNTNEWLAKVSGQDAEFLSINAIATRTGLPQVTLNRRAKADDLTSDQVIAIARAYRYDVIKGLLELGFVTESDLRQPHVIATLRDATDDQIVAEVARRIREGRDTTAFDEPVNLSVVSDSVPDESLLAAHTDDLDGEDEQ